MSISLQAGIYSVSDRGGTHDRRELWEALLGEALRAAPANYCSSGPRHPFQVVLLTELVRSPDRQILRYRVIDANVRRKRNCPTLIELGVGNRFVRTDDPDLTPVHVVIEDRYAEWARKVGAVRLEDHVGLVSRFVQHASSTARKLQPDALRPHTLRPVEVTNASGVIQPLAGNLATLFRQPALFPVPERDFLIVSKVSTVAQQVTRHLQGAFASLVGQGTARLPRLHIGPKVNPDCINLILLDEKLDLNCRAAWLEALRSAESSGVRFKLSKVASPSDRYAARNLAFDLFHLAGGRAWKTVEPQTPFCALDAGHDADRRASRWVKVEVDANQAIISVLATHTKRAEHIPTSVMSSLWPAQHTAILCRDGRLSQERIPMEQRAARENRAVIEVKKSAKAVLWRLREGIPQPAGLGDAVVDSHGDVLLQTINAKANDYTHPVRLTVQGGDPVQLASDFLNQHAIPSLSLGFSRLPGALYFADLVSKFTGDGWTRAIGRGFKVPLVIPSATPVQARNCAMKRGR